MTPTHVPVLLHEVIDILSPKNGETVADLTLGLGGHAKRFLECTVPDGRLIGFDADFNNLSEARKRLQGFGDRVTLHHRNFRDIESVITQPVHVIFADLGLSSPHVDDPARGFTFRTEGPLDLRYDTSSGMSAAEFLLSSSEESIADVLREFGELPQSQKLAHALHQHFRTQKRHLNEWKTGDVVSCVEKIFTWRAPKVLPQVFQALRIAVNDELGALTSLLDALPRVLVPGGRCGIISYHSLEDRMVKQKFRSFSTPDIDPTTGQVRREAPWRLLTKKAVAAGAEELAENSRARSARLRAILRVS